MLVKKYDIVITDVMMPVMDGIELLHEIKRNYTISDIPVVLLTSKAEVSTRLEGLKRGADAFLAKPFSMEELHIVIDNLVDNVRRLKGKFTGAQMQEDHVEDAQVDGNDELFMERVAKCVNEHYSDSEFSTEELAQMVGVSRTHLHRQMKRLTGIPPSDFLRNIRLEKAYRLLKENKVNISQVAYSVGFATQSSFSIIFKRQYGISPKEVVDGLKVEDETITEDYNEKTIEE